MPSRRQALGVGLAMAFVALIATPATAFNSAETETVPGEVIVRFKRDVAKGDALAGSATKATRDLSLPRTKLIKVAGSAKRAIAQLESDPAVAWAEPNYVRERRAIPNDPRFRDLWGALNIGSPSAWNVTTGTREVTLAVADDGVDADHPDLAANIWRNPGVAAAVASRTESTMTATAMWTTGAAGISRVPTTLPSPSSSTASLPTTAPTWPGSSAPSATTASA